MKIVIVTPNLSSGGAERVSATWANGFIKKKYQVTIATNLNNGIKFDVDKQVKLISLFEEDGGKIRKWYNAIRLLRRKLQDIRPDAIIAVMSTCGIIAKLASWGTNIPIVMTEHDAFERPDTWKLTKIEYFLKFYLNRIYNKVTILTSADKEFIKNRLKNIIVLPNPISISPISNLHELQKSKIVLAAGRIDDWYVKGFDTLLLAWKSLSPTLPKKEGDSWWLKVAGTGKKESFEYLINLLPDGEWVFNENFDDGKNHLNTKEKNTGLEKHNSQKTGIWRSEKYHIEFMGFQKDMESLYQKSEIFVLSSRYEGFGLVLVEAMSQGCACVVCDYKGRQKEIVESDINGLICKTNNSEEISFHLLRLICETPLRLQIQKNAIERSKAFTEEKIMDKWDTIFNQIVNH